MRLGRVFDCPPLERWHVILGQWASAKRKRGQPMKSWTKTLRVLRQLVHRLDDRTRLSDQALGSRMLRDSLLPQHRQARVCWRASGERCPEKTEYYLCELFATYHELELEMMSRPPSALPKPPPPRLCPEVQRSWPGDADDRDANLVSSPAGWSGPDPTVWIPEPRHYCYCPRGDRCPLSTEQRQDTSTVLEEDPVFVAASTRDPWANAMEGKGIDLCIESLFSPMRIAKTRCRKSRPGAPASTTAGSTLRTSRARRSSRGKRGPGKSVLTSLMREELGVASRRGCAKGQLKISCRPATRHSRVGGCDQDHDREIRGSLSPPRLVWARARAPYSRYVRLGLRLVHARRRHLWKP